MNIPKTIDNSIEENDPKQWMDDDEVLNPVKGMGLPEEEIKPYPSPPLTPKQEGFRPMYPFIMITCIIIGSFLSNIYFYKSTHVRDALIKIISTEEFSEMLIENGTLAHLSGFDGKDGLPGEKGEPGPPGPMGAVNQGAFNGVSGWELRESKSFIVELGKRKTVSMSCSPGKLLLGGGYNAEECNKCSGVTSFPSSKNSWEATLDNKMGVKSANLKVYVICAEPTL